MIVATTPIIGGEVLKRIAFRSGMNSPRTSACKAKLAVPMMRVRIDFLPNDASGSRRTSTPFIISRFGYTAVGSSYPRRDV
jgi:hypothetical protein